jgi:hypothetical protein
MQGYNWVVGDNISVKMAKKLGIKIAPIINLEVI